MSNPTTPFNWQMPTNTDLVTDLPADFEVFGQAVATSMADLLGGTSGQILSKATNADMDFAWIANDQGDITGVTATSPLTGGGTSGAITVGIQSASTTQSGAVQLSDSTSTTSSILASTPTATKSAYDLAAAAVPKSTVTTAGDVIYGTGSAAVTRLGIGTAGQVLRVNSGATAPEWATPAAGATLVGCSLNRSTDLTVSNNAWNVITYDVENYDTDGFHSNVTNTSRITIPAGKAGKYQILTNVLWNTSAVGERYLSVTKNGTEVVRMFGGVPTGSGQFTQTLATIENLAVNDYLEMRVFQTTGGNLTALFNGFNYYFTVNYIGA
jgi:hypothetical protein